MRSLAVGSTSVAAIYWKDLSKIRIRLPPLPEQRKIAAILSSVDEAIQATQAVIEQTRRVKEGLLQDLLTKGIGHTRFKQTEIGEIPEAWEIRAASQVTSLCTYGFTNPMPTTSEGPWIVTAANIVDGTINYASTRKTSQTAYDEDLTDKSKPIVGDLLVTKDGSLGRVAVVDRTGICINQSVAVLRPARLSSRFLAYVLEAPLWQERMLADAGGSTIKHIYITKLARMPIVVPPHGERTEIVRHLDAITDQVEAQLDHVGLLRTVKSGLLQDLMTGTVRVSV